MAEIPASKDGVFPNFLPNTGDRRNQNGPACSSVASIRRKANRHSQARVSWSGSVLEWA